MILNSIEFRIGLEALAKDDDGPDAEAAAQILSETILWHREWLLAHKRKDE